MTTDSRDKKGWKVLHVPTPETRQQVEELSGIAGWRHAEIAEHIGVSEKTLRKHYKAELRRGTVVAVQQVAQSLFDKAMSGDVTAAIFFLKRRHPAVWGDKAGEDADDAPAPVRVEVSVVDARKRADA